MMYEAISFNILKGSGNFVWGTVPQILVQRNLDLVMYYLFPGQAYRKKNHFIINDATERTVNFH